MSFITNQKLTGRKRNENMCDVKFENPCFSDKDFDEGHH